MGRLDEWWWLTFDYTTGITVGGQNVDELASLALQRWDERLDSSGGKWFCMMGQLSIRRQQMGYGGETYC